MREREREGTRVRGKGIGLTLLYQTIDELRHTITHRESRNIQMVARERERERVRERGRER